MKQNGNVPQCFGDSPKNIYSNHILLKNVFKKKGFFPLIIHLHITCL